MGPIGFETIAGILVTIVSGEYTPLSCYVGVHGSTGGSIELAQPSGTLGCEYDIERLRLFFEHQSSPVDGGYSPGVNHAGIKYLFPTNILTYYIGGSYEFSGTHTTLDNPLFVVGLETPGDIRFFAEHINSAFNPEGGETLMGVKYIF